MSIINSVKRNNITYKVAPSATFTCSTASATAAKTISGLDTTEITDGLTINVLFEKTNTVASPTLNGYALYQYTNIAVGKTENTSWHDGEVVPITFKTSGNTFICLLNNGGKETPSSGNLLYTKMRPVPQNRTGHFIWATKTWNGGPSEITGRYIWTDGANIYYSNTTTQYVLNKSTSTWSVKKWSGLTSFSGDDIWTDGDNIYYSNGSGSGQYVLDKTTSTWNAKSWTGSGISTPSTKYIWTDGENIYYSYSSTQKVFNKSTSTWATKTWTGLSADLNGSRIWTDGTNIYFSSVSTQYVLNIQNSNWSAKTWTGLTSFIGTHVWTDGTNIYYSTSTKQYVLNKSTSTWSSKTWSGLTDFEGEDVWTDGNSIYFSYNTVQRYLGLYGNTAPDLNTKLYKHRIEINYYDEDPDTGIINDGTTYIEIINNSKDKICNNSTLGTLLNYLVPYLQSKGINFGSGYVMPAYGDAMDGTVLINRFKVGGVNACDLLGISGTTKKDYLGTSSGFNSFDVTSCTDWVEPFNGTF